MKRNILFSHEKETVRAAKLFWKDCIKKLKGRKVNNERMEKRRSKAEIEEYDGISLQQANEKLKIEEERWTNLIKFGKEIREKGILDFHHCELNNETVKEKKK